MVTVAYVVEELLTLRGLPHTLTQVTAMREQAAQALVGWSRARFLTECGNIDRLLECGDLQATHTAAQYLLERCLEAGESAYQEAIYDIALAHFKLGKTLIRLGATEAALQPLTGVQQRFQTLANTGNIEAKQMAPVAISEYGNCLRDLGRLDKAAAAYEEAIQRAEHLDTKREMAVNKFQLGLVRMLQQRYDEALAAYMDAREIFETLGEPRTIALAWHRIGLVHGLLGHLEQAEWAYRQALAIRVQQKDRSGEADSLNELGTLYSSMGRLEEAVTFYRQAVDVDATLRNLIGEGRTRHNLAITLIKLQRNDEARVELHRAIECKKPFSHAAEPWTTWSALYYLEQATGNQRVAVSAWQQSVQCYLVFRRAGGENHTPGAQLCTRVAHAIRQGDTTETTQFLTQAAAAADTPAWLKAMLPKLQAILHGDRDPALAADPGLYYRDAAELLLLLETLGAG